MQGFRVQGFGVAGFWFRAWVVLYGVLQKANC